MNKRILNLCIFLLLSNLVHAQNWPQFRGPQASGVAEGQDPPVNWDIEKNVNVRWKTPIPGLSLASPIVWGEKVFITTAVNANPKPFFKHGLYGAVDSVKDEEVVHQWKVYCLDKKTGKILWERIASEGIPKVKRHTKSSHDSSTPATDGKHVVAFFGSQGLFCYDVNGKLVWKVDLGTLDSGWFYDPDYQWGTASSPIIYKNLVILQNDLHKDSHIVAFDLKTGKQVWRAAREEHPSWGTPTIYESKNRAEIITNATKHIVGYDALTGKELWRLKGNSEITAPTPFVAHDLIFVTSGYRPIQPIYAIKAGAASGDITLKEGQTSNEHIAWSLQRGGPYMPTPVVYGDYLYVISNQGVITCYNAKTGEKMYQERVAGKGGAFTASPVAADGKIYFSSEDGEIHVVKAGPKYELIGTNLINEVVMTTPAISSGLFIARGLNTVFAFGASPASKTKSAKTK